MRSIVIAAGLIVGTVSAACAGNSSTIVQEGLFNGGFTQQFGRTNQSTTVQYGHWNNAITTQVGRTNDAGIGQIGHFNNAEVFQYLP